MRCCCPEFILNESSGPCLGKRNVSSLTTSIFSQLAFSSPLETNSLKINFVVDCFFAREAQNHRTHFVL